MKIKVEWTLYTSIWHWALPLHLQVEQCDLGHAICVNISLLCLRLVLMFDRELEPRQPEIG